jgi:hypothetical protein
MGVSFFEGLDGSSLQTSSAQLFDERGEGLILKGGPGLKDKSDRQPFLSAVDAFNLTRTALQSYKKEHGNYPVSSPMLYPATRLGAHDSLTIIRLHQSFAVSAFRFATASVKTGRRHKQGEPRWLSVKRKRAGSSAWSTHFIASGMSKMDPGAAISIMSLSFGMLGFVILGLTIIGHL